MSSDKSKFYGGGLPPVVQQQLRVNLMASRIGPIFTPMYFTSGTSYVLSGTNADGRVAVGIVLDSTYNLVQGIRVGTALADVGESQGYFIHGHQGTAGFNAFLTNSIFPCAQGHLLYGYVQGTSASGGIWEW